MNYTTSDYLNQLEQDREDLVDNLETKGITGLTGDETFTELVPEVLNIESSVDTTDIRNVINMTNANITSQTPFSDYPQSLYTGYITVLKDKYELIDNMPKSISVGSISEGLGLPIYEDKMSKVSTQDGTPTPENPIAIKTVIGYRNLFNPNQTLEFGQYSNGTWATSNYRITTEYIPTKKGEKWNIYIDKDDIQKICLINYNLFDENENWIGSRVENGDISFNGYKSHFFEINLDNVSYMRITFRSSVGTYEPITFDKIRNSISQLTIGLDEKPYIPYGTNWIYTTISDGTNSITTTIPLNENEIVGKLTVLDELIIDKNGHCWLNKKFNKIDSYNGETITTDYMSTTGGLDTGATVYYVLDTPQLIDLNYTADLTLYEGNNTITNSEDMDMEIKYIKDTYE